MHDLTALPPHGTTVERPGGDPGRNVRFEVRFFDRDPLHVWARDEHDAVDVATLVLRRTARVRALGYRGAA